VQILNSANFELQNLQILNYFGVQTLRDSFVALGPLARAGGGLVTNLGHQGKHCTTRGGPGVRKF